MDKNDNSIFEFKDGTKVKVDCNPLFAELKDKFGFDVWAYKPNEKMNILDKMLDFVKTSNMDADHVIEFLHVYEALSEQSILIMENEIRKSIKRIAEKLFNESEKDEEEDDTDA